MVFGSAGVHAEFGRKSELHRVDDEPGNSDISFGIFNEGVGKAFTNTGTFDVQNSGTVFNDLGTIVNIGTFKKTANSGTATINNPFSNLGGTIDDQAGTLFLAGGGTHTGGTFSVWDCDSIHGEHYGNKGLHGLFRRRQLGPGNRRDLYGRRRRCNLEFPVSRLVWTGGNIASSGSAALTISSGSGLTINSAGNVNVSANVTNQGTITLASGILNVQSASR